MNKRKLIRLATVFAAGLVFMALQGLDIFHHEQASPAPVSATTTTVQTVQASSTVETNALVVRDVDGDTIVVKLDGSNDEVKIRLLGVDTPESVDPRKTVQCFGKEASKHTKELLEGKRIRLEEDPQADNVDKYGRLLRNVVMEDGTDFNASLVRDGFAHAYLSFPLDKKRKAQLAALETEAKEAERGLWNPQTCSGKP